MATRKAKPAAATLNLTLLAAIVAATQASSFVYTSEEERAPLVAAELVEINPDIKDGEGKVATRATQAGIDKHNAEAFKGAASGSGDTNTTTTEGNTMQNAENAAPKAKQSFALDDGIQIPKAKRGVGGAVYPFDSMAVGQSFFVPATAEKPNPAKSLASTVSSATKRYADTDKRKFIVRSMDGGARVWRTE